MILKNIHLKKFKCIISVSKYFKLNIKCEYHLVSIEQLEKIRKSVNMEVTYYLKVYLINWLFIKKY